MFFASPLKPQCMLLAIRDRKARVWTALARWRWGLPRWTRAGSGKLFLRSRLWWCGVWSQQILGTWAAGIVREICSTHSNPRGGCWSGNHLRTTGRRHGKQTWPSCRTWWDRFHQGGCWWLGLSFGASLDAGKMETKSVACGDQSTVPSGNCSLALWLQFRCFHHHESARVELCIFTPWGKWHQASSGWVFTASIAWCCWIRLRVAPCGVWERSSTSQRHFWSAWAVAVITQHRSYPRWPKSEWQWAMVAVDIGWQNVGLAVGMDIVTQCYARENSCFRSLHPYWDLRCRSGEMDTFATRDPSLFMS